MKAFSHDRSATDLIPAELFNKFMQRRTAPLYWVLTAIILWAYAALSVSAAVMAISWAIENAQGSADLASAMRVVEHTDSHEVTPLLFRTAVIYVVSAVLCLFAWFSMRRRTQTSFLAGAIAVIMAPFISVFRSLSEYIHLGTSPGLWIEPLFIWPPLIYTIVFAYRGSRTLKNAAGADGQVISN